MTDQISKRCAVKFSWRFFVSPGDGGGTIQRWVPWGTLAFILGGTVSWIQRPGDFAGYLTVGELALAGQHVYRAAPPGINTWPPFFSLLCVPLALLARPTPYLARGCWIAINFALLWVILRMLTQLV